MKTNILNYLIFFLLAIGIYGAGSLTYHELLQEGICPKLGSIPACYIILSCFVVPFFAHLLDKWKAIYFIFTGTALALAMYASIGQIFDKVHCPQTEGGLPMCYISFVLFACLVLAKIIVTKTKY